MQKYKIVVAYDGTDYYGWQIQKDLPSVTQRLQDCFAKTFNKKITIVGASRTDGGVHAQGQVALFRTDLAVSSEAMLYAWNNILPDDILIRSLSRADDAFHPFHNVERKTYQYHFFQQQPLPSVQRRGWYYRPTVDLDKLKAALDVFIGTHDFSAFCAADVEDQNRVRTVDAISIEYIHELQAYRISVTAQRFLRYMIRRMVGAALKIASTPHMSVDYLREVLASQNPNNPLPTAAAKGLTLYKIKYK